MMFFFVFFFQTFVAEDDEEPEESAKVPNYNKLIMPEFVINLKATDEFLKQRIMNLPESEVINTHNTEEGLVRRLEAYRAANTEEDTVLNYFDELEFHPEDIGMHFCPLISDCQLLSDVCII